MSSQRRALLALLPSLLLGACSSDAPSSEDLDSASGPDADSGEAADVAEDLPEPEPDAFDDTADAAPDIPVDVRDVTEQDADAVEVDTPDSTDVADEDAEVMDTSDVDEEGYTGPIAPIGIDLCGLQFSDVSGTGYEQVIQIGNWSENSFVVADIVMPPEAGEAFVFDVSELPLEVPPDSIGELTFLYTSGLPGAPSRVDYTLVLQQDEAEREVVCRLERIPLPDLCDTINIEMSVVDDPRERSGRALGWAKPLDLVRLEAVSDNPSTSLAEIAWRVENAPAFANELVDESEEEPGSPTHRQYSVHTLGEHRICADTISTTDEFCTECADIVATLDDGLWMQLVVPFPEGASDLQLHVVPASAAWFDEESDSWPGSPEAAWAIDGAGYAGSASATGPSYANVVGECEWFAIGVFHDGGATAAPLLHLFIDGVPGDLLSGPPLDAGEFWDAGRVHLPSNTFDPANIHLPDFELGVDRPAETPLMSRLDLCTGPVPD